MQIPRLAVVQLSFLLLFVGGRATPVDAPRTAHPLDDLSRWVIEQMPGGSVTARDGRLEIEDAAGVTVWWRDELTVPLEISYTATLISAGGRYDRISDLNCFWLASDPRHPELFRPGHGRTGAFATYDGLRTYYVGYGGNENTTTRFRRYAGGGEKPLLPEHDLREPKYLLEGNRSYRIRLTADDAGVVRYFRDEELIFEFRDPQPLRTGWFGIRTVWSHLRVTDFTLRHAGGER